MIFSFSKPAQSHSTLHSRHINQKQELSAESTAKKHLSRRQRFIGKQIYKRISIGEADDKPETLAVIHLFLAIIGRILRFSKRLLTQRSTMVFYKATVKDYGLERKNQGMNRIGQNFITLEFVLFWS